MASRTAVPGAARGRRPRARVRRGGLLARRVSCGLAGRPVASSLEAEWNGTASELGWQAEARPEPTEVGRLEMKMSAVEWMRPSDGVSRAQGQGHGQSCTSLQSADPKYGNAATGRRYAGCRHMLSVYQQRNGGHHAASLDKRKFRKKESCWNSTPILCDRGEQEQDPAFLILKRT